VETRVSDFLRRDAERGAADVADAIDNLEKTLREKQNKDTIIIEFPIKAAILLSLFPVIISLCFCLFIRWFLS
jgi:hypothetical protein